MSRLKFIAGIALLILTAFVSFGLFTIPNAESVDSENFSAERAAKYIEVIASEPHSVEHPVERSKVRNYLVDKLTEMGGEPQIHEYDSIEFRYGGYFDIGNVYCEFNPTSGPAKSYILLVAHFDSRFRQTEHQKTVYSYGASDDAYGVASILELLSQSLKYRDQWKQGIKILFTDSEENHLDGMKSEYKFRKELFENVGLTVNLEARGVKGPALLFETSPNNENLLDFYSLAPMPYGYSLTTIVYRFLPNFTDFTVVKDDLPGINFSAIDNINYYHVDDDNYENINLSTIQHYGSQLEPLVKEFLTSGKYSDPNILKGEEDVIFFTLPLLGLFTYTKGQFTLFNAIAFALFCLALVLNLSARNATLKGVLRKAFFIFLSSLLVLVAGEGIAYLTAVIGGVPFNITDTRYLSYSPYVVNAALFLLIIIYLAIYFKNKRRSNLLNIETLLGASLVLLVLSAVLFFVIGENFFFAVPLFLVSLALVLHIFVFLNILSLPILLLVALMGFSFLYVLSVAITIGALGVVMFMAFFYIILVTGLFECYITQKRL